MSSPLIWMPNYGVIGHTACNLCIRRTGNRKENVYHQQQEHYNDLICSCLSRRPSFITNNVALYWLSHTWRFFIIVAACIYSNDIILCLKRDFSPNAPAPHPLQTQAFLFFSSCYIWQTLDLFWRNIHFTWPRRIQFIQSNGNESLLMRVPEFGATIVSAFLDHEIPFTNAHSLLFLLNLRFRFSRNAAVCVLRE